MSELKDKWARDVIVAERRVKDAAFALLAACEYVEFAAEGIDCDDDDLVTITLKMGGIRDIRAAIDRAKEQS